MAARKLLAGFFCLGAALHLAAAPYVGAQHMRSSGVGEIRGTVTSAADGKPIPAVTVQASGDDGSGSAQTDANGRFAVELPPGVYRVKFAHPDYDERSYLNVIVTSDESKSADVTLRKGGASASVSGVEQLVVTGRYVKRSVDQARYSESVLDVLSAQDFSVTADSNVSDAVARVTGVTVVDDKYVYVRGLGERYSTTLFNGALLPSPEPTRRVVPLDLFPAGAMEQLSVQKTYAPYLPADFSGGSLQMTTRSIPAERQVALGVSTEYNTETTFRRVPWAEGDSQDWTGFSGGQRDLPSIIEDLSVSSGDAPAELDDLTDEELRAAGLSLNRNYDVDDITIPANVGADAIYSDRMKTPRGGHIGWLLGGRYKNDWQYTREQRRTTQFTGAPEEGGVAIVGDSVEQEETDNTIGYAGLASTEWQIDRRNALQATLFATRLTDKRFINDFGFLTENAAIVDRTVEEWEERQLWSAQLIGSHEFRRLAGLEFDWGVTYAEASRNKPNTRRYDYGFDEDTGDKVLLAGSASNSQEWERLDDEAWDVLWNAGLPLTVTERLKITPKVGFKYFDKTRDSERRVFRFVPRFSGEEFDEIRRGGPGEIWEDDNIGADRWEIFELTSNTDFYEASEKITAAYFQLDNEIFHDWNLMTGFRFEKSEQKVDTFDVRGGVPVKVDLNKEYVLPAVSLTWSFRDDMQLRGAFSQTLNRPDLRELSPAAYLDPVDREVYVGNPDLQIAEIDNYDLRWEWYYGGLNNLQVAGFYKDITDPIEVELVSRGSSVLRTYQNAEFAEVYGIEVSLRQGLGILHDWVRDFYFVFNGAWMDSEVETTPDSAATNRKRRLQNQSDWIVNWQLTYENLVRDMQATVAFNAAGDRLDSVGIYPFDDSFEETAPQLDFIYRQGFELWNQPMSFRLRAKNLIDPEFNEVRGDITEKSYRTGRSFEFSFDWEF
jgi:TonB-dependent receptor